MCDLGFFLPAAQLDTGQVLGRVVVVVVVVVVVLHPLFQYFTYFHNC
jgi:hypothetical protein